MVTATQTISRLCKWPLGGKTPSAESSLSADTQPSRVADSKWKLNFGLQQPLLETEAPETGSHALKLLVPLPPSDLKQSDIRKGLWTTHLSWQILCQSLISFDCFILTCVLMYNSVSLFDTKRASWRHLCFLYVWHSLAVWKTQRHRLLNSDPLLTVLFPSSDTARKVLSRHRQRPSFTLKWILGQKILTCPYNPNSLCSLAVLLTSLERKMAPTELFSGKAWFLTQAYLYSLRYTVALNTGHIWRQCWLSQVAEGWSGHLVGGA